jgi:hypothetical protein
MAHGLVLRGPDGAVSHGAAQAPALEELLSHGISNLRHASVATPGVVVNRHV